MDSSAPPSAVTSQGPLSAAANRFKDLIGGIFKEVLYTFLFLQSCEHSLAANYDIHTQATLRKLQVNAML